MKLDRRMYLQGAAIVAASTALTSAAIWSLDSPHEKAATVPICRGASYSFRKFGQAELIQFMKELHTP